MLTVFWMLNLEGLSIKMFLGESWEVNYVVVSSSNRRKSELWRLDEMKSYVEKAVMNINKTLKTRRSSQSSFLERSFEANHLEQSLVISLLKMHEQ